MPPSVPLGHYVVNLKPQTEQQPLPSFHALLFKLTLALSTLVLSE